MGGIAAYHIERVYQQLPGNREAPTDRPRPVESWTAQQLGVHPAIHGTTPLDAGTDSESAFVLPAYLARDHDQQLRDHLVRASCGEQATLVLVRGGSCTGKTRTAFEAVRSCLSDWQLVFPKNAKRLLALLDAGADALPPRTVLWLNEAQNYLLGTDAAEAAAALHSRLELPGPLVVLGTLWPEYHRTLTGTPEPGRDAHPNARALLDQAELVDVPATFTDQELRDGGVRRDRSVATAIRTSIGGRITQTLAAGPQLIDRYEQATGPHGPYGRAVITAAMDARRLGHTSPLPARLLRAAAPGYLTEEQRAAADPDTWFDHAVHYAREKVMGVAGSLEPVADPDGMGALPDVYRVSDYLDHHARTVRRDRVPPDFFWTAVHHHAASPADLYELAHAARSRGRLGLAAGLYQQAVDAGEVEAFVELVQLTERAEDTEGAERHARRAADAGIPEALWGLAADRKLYGDAEGARRLYRHAADAGDPYSLRKLAQWREEAGDDEGARQLYTQAADGGDPYSLRELVRWREEAGDTEGVKLLYQRAADAGDGEALLELARWLKATGDAEGAERYARQAADAGDIMAPDQLVHWRVEAGDAEGVKRLYQQAADAGDGEALLELAQWHEEAGDAEGARRLYQRAADAPYALLALVRLRERTGDPAEAERLAERAAEAGDTRALRLLAPLRARAGDAAGAERLAQRACEAGDAGVLEDLAQLRADAGDAEGARRLYQRAADAGDIRALRELTRLRERAGDRAGAEQLAQRACEAGNTWVLETLAQLRADAGDAESAKRLYQQAADAGAVNALLGLVRLREEAGDVEGAARLRRFGLAADGSPAQPWVVGN